MDQDLKEELARLTLKEELARLTPAQRILQLVDSLVAGAVAAERVGHGADYLEAHRTGVAPASLGVPAARMAGIGLDAMVADGLLTREEARLAADALAAIEAALRAVAQPPAAIEDAPPATPA